jgi:hypothetical protein
LTGRLGVYLNIENIFFNGYLMTPAETNAFVDGFKSKHVRVHFDTGNIMEDSFLSQGNYDRLIVPVDYGLAEDGVREGAGCGAVPRTARIGAEDSHPQQFERLELLSEQSPRVAAEPLR